MRGHYFCAGLACLSGLVWGDAVAGGAPIVATLAGFFAAFMIIQAEVERREVTP